MKLSGREKILFYAAVIIVLAGLVQMFVFRALSDKISSLNRDILIKEKALRKSLRTYNLRDNILDDHRKYGEYLKIEGSDEEITARLFKEVEKIARKTKVYVADIKPHPLKEASYYKKFIIEIQVEASLDNLTEFLYYLHKSTLPLRAEKLALAVKKEGNPTVLKGSMFINAVFL